MRTCVVESSTMNIIIVELVSKLFFTTKTLTQCRKGTFCIKIRRSGGSKILYLL